jgi:sulfotransferase family protein
MQTVYWRVNDPWLRVASWVDWGAGLYYPMLRDLFDKFFENDFARRGKEMYMKHCENVRHLVPKERLLEYDIRQGWDPLCKFLGEEMPKEEFPRCNGIDSFVARCSARNRRQICNGLFRILVLSLLIYVAVVTVDTIASGLRSHK